MGAVQKLLFADPRPLLERLGQGFFRDLPQTPGVYLMRDTGGKVLYVGKAKNLRKRLGSYRVANPDRLARRHLRLLVTVARIDIEECSDERAALKREASLLRSLQPRFNRAGTWRPPPWFLAFRVQGDALAIEVVASPMADGRWHGPIGSGAKHLRNSIARLVWFGFYSQRGVSQLPVGWLRGRSEEALRVRLGASEQEMLPEAVSCLEQLFGGRTGPFSEWIRGKIAASAGAFDKTVLEADCEFVEERFGGRVPGDWASDSAAA